MKIMTLDSRGYISDPPLVADIIMRNFFVSNYTQTNVHWGNIHSLPYLVSMYAEDILGLTNAIRNALTTMLSVKFDRVDIDVTAKPIVEDNESQQEIVVDAKLYLGLNVYSLGKLISLVDNRVSGIIDTQ